MPTHQQEIEDSLEETYSELSQRIDRKGKMARMVNELDIKRALENNKGRRKKVRHDLVWSADSDKCAFLLRFE